MAAAARPTAPGPPTRPTASPSAAAALSSGASTAARLAASRAPTAAPSALPIATFPTPKAATPSAAKPISFQLPSPNAFSVSFRASEAMEAMSATAAKNSPTKGTAANTNARTPAPIAIMSTTLATCSSTEIVAALMLSQRLSFSPSWCFAASMTRRAASAASSRCWIARSRIA